MDFDFSLRGISIVVAGAGTLFCQIVGGWDILIYALLVLMVLDYVSGVISAGYNKKLSASVGFWGISKKVMILIIVFLAVTLDIIFHTPGAIRTLVIIWYSANEGLSIIENASNIGLPVPPWLKDKLEQAKEEK